MAVIQTGMGPLNVSDRLSQSARAAIIAYINTNNKIKIELNKSVSVTNAGAGRARIPTQCTVKLRIDLASPRAGAHGGAQCPHAQVTEAKRHGGPTAARVARDRLAGGQSATRAAVNYDRIRIGEAYALSNVETVQICKTTTNLPQGILAWLREKLAEGFD